MTLFDLLLEGDAIAIDPDALLGEGGEGCVYAHGELAIKVYHAATSAHGEKLRAFPPNLDRAVVAPTGLVTDRTGLVVGYAMPRVSADHDLATLANAAFRRGRLGGGHVCRVFQKLADRLRALHARGVVVGDLNGHNVIVRGEEPLLLDADSMQFGAFPCPVAAEETLDPRLFGKDLAAAPAFDPASDAYAFAVLLFTALLYVHPYGGTHPTLTTLLRRAEARVSVFDDAVRCPPVAEPLRALSDDLLQYFEGIFRGGGRHLPAASLFDADFVRCASCGTEFTRRACPRCASAPRTVSATTPASSHTTNARVVARTRGRFLAVAYRGGLVTLEDDGGRLQREGGVDLGATPIDPKATFFLTDRGALVAEGGHVEERAPGDRPVRRASVAVNAAGASLFASTRSIGLGVVDGWLVRLDDGVRIGSVFAHGARLAADRGLGFGFYRAGNLTIGFLCRAAEGGLFHPTMPALRGRLDHVVTAFDDDAVFFRASVTEGGRQTASARLYDARGKTVAALDGAPDSHPLLARDAAVVVRQGIVLVAHATGLTAYAPSGAGSFVPRRTFVAPPLGAGMSLVPGKPGTLYAATATTIVELTL